MKLLRRNSGFTLLEVIIALTVFAILGTLAFSGLNSILKWQSDLEEKSSQIQAIQLTLKYLERDINQAIPRTIRDQFGDSQPAFLLNTDNEISFTYSGWRNPAGLSRSVIQRISYSIDEDNNLVRHSWNRLDGALEVDSREVVLIEDIDEISWEFVSQDNNLVDQWPPINAGPDDITSLPRAVEVTFSVVPFGEIVRIFTVPQ